MSYKEMSINEKFERATELFLGLGNESRENITRQLTGPAKLAWMMLVSEFEEKGPNEWFELLLKEDRAILYELFTWVQTPIWEYMEQTQEKMEAQRALVVVIRQ